MPHQVTMPLLGLTMEEGTITEWLKKEGETVAKEEPLFIVETDKSAVEVGAPAAGVLSQIIVQVGQTAPVSAPIAVIAQPGEAVSTPAPAAPAAAAQAAAPARAAPERIIASPLARRMAAEHGVDLAQVKGTGPGGRITERDVTAAVEAGPAAPAEAPATLPAVAAATGAFEPLNRVRRITAERMAASSRSVARVTLLMEGDMTEAVRFRTQLGPE